jgi:hypothetical protein
MTNPETEYPAPDASLALVEAFVDGELVDPDALRAALDQPGAREHLVEILRLRSAVGAMAPRTWSVSATPPSRVRRAARWGALAAGVVLSVTTGYLFGQRSSPPLAPRGASLEAVLESSAPAAPEATHVIPLRPGINWTETSGGR